MSTIEKLSLHENTHPQRQRKIVRENGIKARFIILNMTKPNHLILPNVNISTLHTLKVH